MGIVLFRTDDENIKAAEHLAPSAELDKLSIPGYIGIMAVDDEKRVPAGLAICQMIGLERLDVIWLFVHEDFRNRGIAQQLIMAACDTAVSLGYSNIGFRLEARDITDEEYSDLNSFLVANGFSIGFEIEGSLMAGVSDFEIDLDHVRGLGKVSPVDETNPEELESFVRDVSILFDDEDFSEKKYAADLSFSYKNNGILEGVLLSKVLGEVIHVYLLEPASNEDVAGLLLKTLMEKAKGLGVKTFSLVRTEANKAMLDTLFDTTAFLPGFLWIAGADMFDEEPEPLDESNERDPIYSPWPKEVRWVKTEFYGDVL